MAAALVAVNTAQVGLFGEVEYWFALVKVLAIVAFIAAGLTVITGLGARPAVGFRNLFDGPGGFLPNGWRGVWLALTLVITSYMGIEGSRSWLAKPSSPKRRSRARCGRWCCG